MTDRVANKEKINKSSSKNNNEAVHHQQHSLSNHHHQQSSNSKDDRARSHEDNSIADTFIKRYKVIEKIGEGSYSEVLKCQNREDGSIVACKRLKHIYKNLDDVVNIPEIATLRSIQKHSNILQMIEIHYDKTLGKVSLVFELMDINLYELIKDRKRLLPESRVRAIMFQLFRALRHLHKLGVFHRDIKPENILIKTKTDQLKLGDLGSVRGMFSRPPYTEYISTRWYRSPECLLTAGHYSHKMDIWAAGCVFYEVLTLRPLFPGSSELDQINRINNVLGPPPPKLLDTFQKQAEMERDTYRGQSQLSRRQQIQKVLNTYSSRYLTAADSNTKNSSSNSLKNYRRNNMEFHFAGKEGTGIDKILPSHITREAKDIIKSCLCYDPEQRPTAQRIVQLSYFSELRESYSKNPEKVSSKSVVLICGDTVTDHCAPIELGTLGDHKTRYRRGVAQKNTTKGSSSKIIFQKKASSIKTVDTNNNPCSRRSSSSTEKAVMMVKASRSRSKLSGIKESSMGKMKNADASKLQKPDENRERKSSSHVRSSAIIGSRVINVASGGRSESSHIPTSKARVGSHQPQHRLPAPIKKKQQQVSSSTTSFESVQSPDKKRRNYIKQRENPRSEELKPMGIHTTQDISLSPYVKPPSELKFLRNKIKSDQNSRNKNFGPTPQPPLVQPPHQKINNVEHNMPSTRVSVVPPKVAAAAIKYAKVNARKVRGDPIAIVDNITTDQTESSGTNIMTGGKDNRGDYSPTDDTISYATASSVKIGKLRFRQTSQQTNEQQQSSKPPTMKDASSSTSYYRSNSKIPVLTDEHHLSSRRNTKLLNSPPEQRQEPETTEKWRNKGISRIIPMSPERERNIQLLKESLILDKNKRLRLRYQQQMNEQDQLNKNESDIAVKDIESNVLDGGDSSLRKGVTSKAHYDYASQDTLQSNCEQQQGNYSSTAGGAGGKCRHSTTDYENPDVQETSSASAAALENQQRSIFNEETRKGRVVVPPIEPIMKKPVPPKKSSDLYPPEMLHLYSSRYRGPNTNMNILKDSGNSSYIRRSNPESRAQDVKEKLNHKFEQRKHQRELSGVPSSQQIGDQPSKILSERSSYAQYSSSLLGAGEEAQFSRVGLMERRPPLPPLGMGTTGSRRGDYRGISPSPDMTQKYNSRSRNQNGRRPSMIPTIGGDKESPIQMNRRSLSNVGDQMRKDFKENTRRKVERMRSTMRDDVFCSSDDDVVISMRKKFDSLISERARKLSECLKGSINNPYAKDPMDNLPARRAINSNSDEDMVAMSRRSRNNAAAEKSRKYARRELRARMAESLTMNNFSMADNWRVPEHGQSMLQSKPNETEDWVLPPTPKYTEKSGKTIEGSRVGNNSYNPSSVLRARKNNAENEFQESLKCHPSNRINPFPVQDQPVYRRGQIYTPPSNKAVYQSTQLGSMLQDRKLRYSHNNLMPVSRIYGNNHPEKTKRV